MIQAGHYYQLKAVKKVDFGFYLDAEGLEILLPKRFVPDGLTEGDEIKVFIYHDNEDRLIATTQEPFATVGDVALLKCVSKTDYGAFMEWGIMKDVFVPLSHQLSRMQEGEKYIVYLFIDEMTGRVTATEKFQKFLSNDELTVKENETVDLLVWQQTDIGYKVIINNKHTGVVHFSDVFRDLQYGEKLKGFIKKIREENKIDVAIGERGYERVSPETERLLQLLRENDGYLPYNDKSSPDDIYSFFGISKKTFKMSVGALYKDRKIELTKTGIKLLE
ncbi:MAG TPA: S1-like domain-containing RNA-binding protein [Flavipsychrobacter sp.]|nr:S1-like domain-containing RNA-binding protein [Flavipsychrobacter sp.]